MTGQQQRRQLDLEHWKLETRNGSRRLQGDDAPAPGIAGLSVEIDRTGSILITAAYFTYLWLLSGVGGEINFLVSLGYVWLMRARWQDMGAPHGWLVQGASLYFAYDLAQGASFAGASPIVQFIALAPALYACLAPSGIGLPKQEFDASKRIGRGAFILWAFPFLLLAATRSWGGLDQLLTLAWNLVGPKIEHVPASVTFWYLLFVLGGPMVARLYDAGAPRWCHFVFAPLLLAETAVAFDFIASPYAALPDLFVVALSLGLCFWPSRPAESGAITT